MVFRYGFSDHLNRHSVQWHSHLGSPELSDLLNEVPISMLSH